MLFSNGKSRRQCSSPFFFHARTHTNTSFMSLCSVDQTKRTIWNGKKEEPRCIRLYNWHNSSNKLLTQKEAKLFIHTKYIYLKICLVYYLFSFDLLCVCSFFLFFVRAFSTYFIVDDPLSKLGNHSSQLHNLLEFNVYAVYQLARQHQQHWHHRQHRYYADNRALWYVTIHWKVLIFHSNNAFCNSSSINTRANSFFSHSPFTTNIIHTVSIFYCVQHFVRIFSPHSLMVTSNPLSKWWNGKIDAIIMTSHV